MEALVIQGGDGVSGDLIRQFTNGFPHQLVGLWQFGSGITAGYPHGGFSIEVEDDPAFDVPG